MSGGSPNRVGMYIPSKSKTVVSPQRALVVLIPSNSPSGSGAKEVFPQQGLPISPQQCYSPAGRKLEWWRVPQQSVSSSSEESLEGDTFYAFIM